MDENLINSMPEDEITDLPAEDIEQDIVTVQDVVVEYEEEVVIDISESMGWVSGDDRYHDSLLGVELPRQHPIEAITNLREELNEIERLKTVHSDKFNVANYYKWNDAAYDTYGYFVSVVENDKIQICNGGAIFGVVVKGGELPDAGFIGGQGVVQRDNTYGLVVTSGLVDVRCEVDVETGDFVVSNSSGYAKKSSSNYGYRVLGTETKNSTPYAIISLGVQADITNALGADLQAIDTRLGAAETNIISAINVSNQAYNKANEIGVSNQVMSDKVDGALGIVDKIVVDMENWSEQVSNSALIATQAKAIAESAVTSAVAMKNEAVAKADEALTSTLELKDRFDEKVLDIDTKLYDSSLDLERVKADMEAVRNEMQEGLDGVVSDFDKVKEDIEETVNGLQGTVGKVEQDFEDVKKDLETTANDVQGSIKDISDKFNELVDDVAPLLTWPEDASGDEIQGVAGFVKQVKDDSMLLGTIATWKGDTGDSLAGYLQTVGKGYATTEQISKVNETVATVKTMAEENKSSIEAITGVEGSFAGLQAKVDKNEASVATLASHVIGEYVSLETWDVADKGTDKIYYAEDTHYYWYYDGEWKYTDKSYETKPPLSGALSGVQQTADANKASIEMITSFEGDFGSALTGVISQTTSENAEIKALANYTYKDRYGKEHNSVAALDAFAKDNEAGISALAGIDGGLAGLQAQVNENTASVATLASQAIGYTSVDVWSVEDKNSDTVYYAKDVNKYYYWGIKEGSEIYEWIDTTDPIEAGLDGTLAGVKSIADANKAQISSFASWKDGTGDESLAGVISEATKGYAEISALAQTDESVAAIKITSDDNKAALDALTSFDVCDVVSIAVLDEVPSGTYYKSEPNWNNQWMFATWDENAEEWVAYSDTQTNVSETYCYAVATNNTYYKYSYNSTTGKWNCATMGKTGASIAGVKAVSDANKVQLDILASWKNTVANDNGELKLVDVVSGVEAKADKYGAYLTNLASYDLCDVVKFEILSTKPSGIYYKEKPNWDTTNSLWKFATYDTNQKTWVTYESYSWTNYTEPESGTDDDLYYSVSTESNTYYQYAYKDSVWSKSELGRDSSSIAGVKSTVDANKAELNALASYQAKDNDGNPFYATAGIIAHVDKNTSELSTVAQRTFTKDGKTITGLAGLNAQVTENESNVALVAKHIYGDYEVVDEWSEDGKNTDIIYYARDTKRYYYCKNNELPWINTTSAYDAGLPASIAGIQVVTDKHSSSIEQLTAFDADTEVNLTRIEQKADANGAYIQSTVANLDKYSVGPLSQTNGFTLDQAKSVLTIGTIYVPTDTHPEETPVNRDFTKQYYYTWDGEQWVASSSVAVVFSDEYVVGGSIIYWYIPGSDNIVNDGITYSSHTLYKWESNQWVGVATLAGNSQSRAVSQIRQDANSISIDVTNAKGDLAGIKAWAGDDFVAIQDTVSWHDQNGESLVTFMQEAGDNFASASQVAKIVDKDGNINEAAIVAVVNDNGSGISLDADSINFGDYVTVTSNDDTVMNVADKFIVDRQGNVRLSGSIVWGVDSKPTQAVYCSVYKEAPANNTMWSSFPESSEDDWHQTWDNNTDYYGSYTYDGGATWGEPIRLKGENGSDANVTDENVFKVLTGNGTMYGCFQSADNKLYINAQYIKSGTVESDLVLAGHVTAQNIDATGGSIGGFEIRNNALYTALNKEVDGTEIAYYMTSPNTINAVLHLSEESGFSYIGTDGIGTMKVIPTDGANNVGFTTLNTYMADGKLFSNNAEITGKVIAESGYIGDNINGFEIHNNAIRNVFKYESGQVGVTNPVSAYMTSYNTVEYGSEYLYECVDQNFVYIGTDGIGTIRTASYFENYAENQRADCKQTWMADGKLFSNSAEITGRITATSGAIGGFTLENGKLYTNNKSGIEFTTVGGVYIGSDGISVGHNLVDIGNNQYAYCGVTLDASTGKLIANNAKITGNITATSGYIGDKTNGFIIGDTSIRYSKGSYQDYIDGVYIGTDGIGLGSCKFYVTSAGKMYAKDVDISGKITATDGGSIGGWNIENGTLTRVAASNNIGSPTWTLADNITLTHKLDDGNNTSLNFGWSYGSEISGDGNIYPYYGFVTNSNLAFKVGDNRRGILAGTWEFDTGEVVTSYRAAKHDIESLDDRYSILFDNIEPVRFKYNNGQSDRYHTGFILDELKSAMDVAGVDSSEFAAYCVRDEQTGEGGIRYEEIIALLVKEVQALKKEIKEIKENG